MRKFVACAVVGLLAAGCSATAGRAPRAARTTSTTIVYLKPAAGTNHAQSVAGDVIVPNVLGESWAQATATMHHVGFTVGQNVTLCFSDPAALQPLVKTVPTPGAEAAAGSTVVFCN